MVIKGCNAAEKIGLFLTIPQYPGTGSLDCIEILLLVKEQLNNEFAALRVVEEDEEAPVNYPSPLLQSLEGGAEGRLVNELL